MAKNMRTISALKKLCSIGLALIMLVSVFPMSLFTTSAAPAEPKMDGSFESYNLNATPDGWKLLSVTKNGGKGGAEIYGSTFDENYTLNVTGEKNSGQKGLVLAANSDANKATFGYVVAQSPAISVSGEVSYLFDYSLKTVVNSSPTGEYNSFYARIFVVEYDKNGNLISREMLGTDFASPGKPNVDWSSATVTYKTKKDSKTVKLEFYMGGKKGDNYGAKLLIDDLDFYTLSEDKLLNGGFEETKSNGNLVSWYLRPCDIRNNDSNASEFVTNHELSIVKGYHGKAAQIVKKGAGYVTLTSNMMKVAANTTYIVDYALKIAHKMVQPEDSFMGAALYIAEFDASKNLIKRTRLHDNITDKTDWKEFSFSYSPDKTVKYFRVELYCGDHKSYQTFTVLFDDVSVTPFVRENAKDNVHNGGFEDVSGGTIFDWSFDRVNGTTYSSTFDGYNGSKGLFIQRKTTQKGYGMIKSNIFEVTPGKEFKASYMVRFDNFVRENYVTYSILYIVYFDKDGKQLTVSYDSNGNPVKYDSYNEARYYGLDVGWQRRQSYHTVPEGAVTCQLQLRVNGYNYDCWIDEVKLTYTNKGETNYGFNKADKNGEIYGWSVSNPAAAKLDTKTFREGSGSLFISQYVDKTSTQVYCDTLIPVEFGKRYELSLWVKSYDCDISADGVILNARTYDKDGNYLGTSNIIAGRVMTLSNDSTPGNWREVICGVYATNKIAYIRPVLEIPNGKVNMWIDDLQCNLYNLNDEFFDDFDSVRNDGIPDGWETIVEEGNPKFEAHNSIASITAENGDDIGIFSARWDTKMEYKAMKLALNYATLGDTEAKLTIKFFGFNDKEIEEDRFEKELGSTGGEYIEAMVDFVLGSAKYMKIELSNTDDGVVMFQDIAIVYEDGDTSSDEFTWRGYWIWHDEDYRDSVNGTYRYFRYKFTLPEDPVAGNIQITADDYLKLWINGVEYSSDEMNMHWREISVFDDIWESMHAGENVIAVAVGNYTSYAGLMYDGFAEMADGSRVDFYTTTDIISSKVEYEGWNRLDYDDSKWTKTIFQSNDGTGNWEEYLVYDQSAYIKEKFEVVDYTVTDSIIAGDDVTLTMTVIPGLDFTKNLDLIGKLWIRNTTNNVLNVELTQVSGPKMEDWREGEQIVVSYKFKIPDFIATNKYIIQLDTNQVVITNDEIINNRFVKAINVTNNSANQSMKTEIVKVNGTYAVSINGKIQPFNMAKKPNTLLANNSSSVQYLHEAGICLTRIATFIGYNKRVDAHVDCWNGIDDYDWSALDATIYKELSIHQDTYLMPCLYLGVREWWVAQNPDQCVVGSDGTVYDISLFSESAISTAIEANLAMVEHMMAQPYWNRIAAFSMIGGSDTEFIWYGGGPETTIDYSEPAKVYFRKWLTEKYGTDAELQKAWNNKNVTLKTAVVPTLDEHKNETYDSLFDPKVNAAARDFAECMEYREADVLNTFYAAVTEKIDDSRFMGSYIGYLYSRAFYHKALYNLHTQVNKIVANPNIDFVCAPATYSERLDGMAAATFQMVDGILLKGKAVLIEDDYRTCSYINLGRNFYTRDSVGTTYNINDSLSGMIKNQAISLTQGASLWYSNIESIMFEREQFSRVIEIMHGEKYIDLSREKSYTGDVCYIMDEDGYENYSMDNAAVYDSSYEMLYEQKYDLARAGILMDYYSLSDLVDGVVPEYKVYVMINTLEIDAEEKAAIDKHLKKDGKIVLWQWLAGASNRKEISAKNMSEVIGMDVKFDTSELVLNTIITNKDHWLTKGVDDTIGSGLGYRVASPVAIITDKDANVTKLGHLYDGKTMSSLAVMENENWTSIFSSVPGYNVKMFKNVLKKAGVHMYSDNLNDVIYANTNYVGINAAYGGEKVIKLPGTYAVYDVVGQTTYSTSTNEIKFTMEDNQTKLFRLMPVDTNIIYVNTMYQGTLEGKAYNEVNTGDDFSAKITADEGYVIAQIITDTERKTINSSSYTVEFDDVDNSHYVRVIFAPEGSVEGGESNLLLYILIGAGILLVAAAAIFFIIFFKKKKEEEEENAEKVE